jgi:hypothetical protein
MPKDIVLEYPRMEIRVLSRDCQDICVELPSREV